MTKAAALKDYANAMQTFREASAGFRQAQTNHLAGRATDEAFLAARRTMDEAGVVADQAETAVRRHYHGQEVG